MATKTGDRIPMCWDECVTLDEYIQGEYIDGEFVVNPAPTGRHQDIVFNVASVIAGCPPLGVRVRPGRGSMATSDRSNPMIRS